MSPVSPDLSGMPETHSGNAGEKGAISMAQHGSHKYEIKRNRIRNDLDNHGIPDKNADEAANRILANEHGTKNRGLPDPKLTRYLRRSTRKEGANGPEGRRS
jgi:hypothetical protein